MAGPNKILVPGNMLNQAMSILDETFEREYAKSKVFSLFEVALKDGTVLGIMLELKPYEIDRIQEVIKDGYKVLTLANDTESILFPAADIKYIKALRVTSKE